MHTLVILETLRLVDAPRRDAGARRVPRRTDEFRRHNFEKRPRLAGRRKDEISTGHVLWMGRTIIKQ